MYKRNSIIILLCSDVIIIISFCVYSSYFLYFLLYSYIFGFSSFPLLLSIIYSLDFVSLFLFLCSYSLCISILFIFYFLPPVFCFLPSCPLPSPSSPLLDLFSLSLFVQFIISPFSFIVLIYFLFSFPTSFTP